VYFRNLALIRRRENQDLVPPEAPL
jgi:hypothetical protein